MDDVLALARQAGALLKTRSQTLVVAESSSGGLITAGLLAVPGASAYFLGGAVLYTRQARDLLAGIPPSALAGLRPVTEAYELAIARHMQQRFSANLCLVEHGAAGPGGNRYGDPAGRCCIALAGAVERAVVIETGSADRFGNMQAFAAAALRFLLECLSE